MNFDSMSYCAQNNSQSIIVWILKRILNTVGVVLILLHLSGCGSKSEFRKISLEEYRSKMQAGWLGQMAGVGWGAPSEFRFNGMIIPEDEVPQLPEVFGRLWI
jgi:hypothetical protein